MKGQSLDSLESEDTSRESALARLYIQYGTFRDTLEGLIDLSGLVPHDRPDIDSPIIAFVKNVRKWNKSDSDDVVRRIFRAAFVDLVDYLHKVPEGERESDPRGIAMESIEKHAAEHSQCGQSVNWLISFERTLGRNSRKQALHSSLLVAATSAFELLIAAVLRCHYESFSNAISGPDKKYAYGDVAKFATLGDFREACIEDAIENVMRGDVQSWFVPIEKWYGVGLADISAGSDDVVEAYLRRNLLVHNGGLKNRIYLSKTKVADSADNVRIDVDRDYVLEVIDRLHVPGMLVVARVLEKLGCAPVHDILKADLLADSSYDLLVSGRHGAVIELGDMVGRLNTQPSVALTLKINRWISMKSRDSVESIRAEVSAWDVSVLSMRFRLAKLALLDEFEPAVELVRNIVGSPELSQSDFDAWPLFEGLRNYISENSIPDFDFN